MKKTRKGTEMRDFKTEKTEMKIILTWVGFPKEHHRILKILLLA